jgi:hypothetical protein
VASIAASPSLLTSLPFCLYKSSYFPPPSNLSSDMDVVKETLNVAGLLAIVYAPSHLRSKRSSESIIVLFFLRGRKESIDLIDPTAQAAFAWAAEKQASLKQNPRDFIVVTFVRAMALASRVDSSR